MAEEPKIFEPTSNSLDAENRSIVNSKDYEMHRRLFCSPEKDISTLEESNMTCKFLTLQSVFDASNSRRRSAETTEQLSPQAVNSCLKAKNAVEFKDAAPEHGLNPKNLSVNDTEDKENTAVPSATITPGRQHNRCDIPMGGGTFLRSKPERCVLSLTGCQKY